MACYNISYGQNNAVFPCNSFPSFSLLAQRKFAASEQKRTCSFFRARANFTEGNRAKRNGVCGGGKKSCPLRKPAGGTTQSTMQANAEAKRAWTMLSCEEKKMRSILTYSIVLSPQPCYGRRIFSFTPHVAFNSLQPVNATSDIFYYHMNHLGSTAYVTDNNATITQGFLYAPFGEITTEFNATFGSDIIPKYSFNAKELDEETGMYYYEARYYKPPVFTSRDPMFEKKPWFSPYVYCKNNPIIMIDPDGRDEWKVDEMGYVSKTGNKGGIKQQTVIFSNGNTKTFKGKNYHVILSDLTKVEIRDGNNLSKSLGDENMQSAMLNVFKSMADNTNVEWRLDRFNNGNKRDCYAIGTFHVEDKSPGARYMGYSQQSVVTFIHSHPDVDIKEELSSMGWTPPYVFKPSDYYNNTYAPEYSKTTSYVYFPMSNNLWHVRKGKIPSFIKTIKKSSDFFFGTLNTR
jgi:RHS repeat-associated protein